MTHTVWIPMELAKVTHQSKKIGRRFIGKGRSVPSLRDSDELSAFREELVVRMIPKRPKQPFCQPVMLTIVGVWPFVKSTAKKDRHLRWNDGYPDLDNFKKTVLDALVQAGWISNDKLVVAEGQSAKLIGEPCGLFVSIEPVAEPNHPLELS